MASTGVSSTVFTASLSIHVMIKLILVVLFGVTYMYIDKMERIGCECAMHPYRNFIKYFPIFAVVYLLLTIVNPLVIMKNPTLAPVLYIADILYTIGVFVFLFMAIKYVNYLVGEKCKCSEDVRREIVYYWSVVHMAIIAVGVFIILVDVIAKSIFLSKSPSLQSAVVDSVKGSKAYLEQTAREPLKSVRGIPKKFAKIGRK